MPPGGREKDNGKSKDSGRSERYLEFKIICGSVVRGSITHNLLPVSFVEELSIYSFKDFPSGLAGCSRISAIMAIWLKTIDALLP